MAHRGPPTPQPPTVIPPVVSPVPPVQLPAHSAQPAVQPTQPIQPGLMPQSNWSHFKPEFTGKPDEDAEAIFLRTNDWMDTHALQEGVKSKDFV